MARLKNGLSGPMVGKLGNHVGYVRLGQALVRMKSSRTEKKKRTPAQKAASNAFSVVSKFITPINVFLNVSFKHYVVGTGQIPRNAGMSFNSAAVYGEYPDQQFDYSKGIVAVGNLPLAENPVAELFEYDEPNFKAVLKFNWDVNPLWEDCLKRDQVMLLAFFPETGHADWSLSGARRNEGADLLQINPKIGLKSGRFEAHFVETYMAFISDDRMNISNSIYCGRINLTA